MQQRLQEIINELFGPERADFLLSRLAEYWIETPEQLLSASTSSGGKTGIRRLLNISEEELGAIVGKITENMDPEEVQRWQSQQPGGNLGLRLPEDDEPASGKEDK